MSDKLRVIVSRAHGYYKAGDPLLVDDTEANRKLLTNGFYDLVAIEQPAKPKPAPKEKKAAAPKPTKSPKSTKSAKAKDPAGDVQ